MRQDLEKEILDVAPLIFRQREMWYGIECDDGWFDIIKKMAIELEDVAITEERTKLREVLYIAQIKEKFGLLTVYYNYFGKHQEQIRKIVDRYTAMSRETCEHCGKKSQVKTQGWIKYLCKKCAKGKKYTEI